MQINYFFGSDSRSIYAYEILSKHYLNVLNLNIDQIKVITLDNPTKIRGKIVRNDFETYCLDNAIKYNYYDPNTEYIDLQNALVCSFGKIFDKDFLLKNNIRTSLNNSGKLLLNLHMSLLPDLKGPTPIEYAILYSYDRTGVSLFCINEEIDSGIVHWSQQIEIENNDYATDLYDKSFKCFEEFMLNKDKYEKTFMYSGYSLSEPSRNNKKTYKIEKCDLMLNNLNVLNAKTRIRAMNYIGPAIYEYEPDITLKIHSYTDTQKGLKLDLSDGCIYVDYITPPGRNKMRALDWLRGRK